MDPFFASAQHSCSTFLLRSGSRVLIGHNLDDYIPTPGLLVVNPAGISKFNLDWPDLQFTFSGSRLRRRWTSRHASLTANAFGREFPDGGLNEAGLYVGEMTLLSTEYPRRKGLPGIYHHQWIQYLLDNFASVSEVLTDLGSLNIAGHCRWHFFIADRSGSAAVIEFLQGRTVVHAGADLPHPVLCNAPYALELERWKEYAGFGGDKPVDLTDHQGPARFPQAVTLLGSLGKKAPADPVRASFEILQQLDCGNNKWKLVFDLSRKVLHYRTWLAEEIKTVGLDSFDTRPGAPALLLDIHAGRGDTAGEFRPFDAALNRRKIEEMWAGIRVGFPLNLFWKRLMAGHLAEYPLKHFSAPDLHGMEANLG